MKFKVIVITQARIGSTRFPRKVLKELNDDTLLGLHLDRLKKSKSLEKIVVATTHEADSDIICNIAKGKGVEFYKGSQNDVLDRFYKAALNYSPDYVVRVTSDCPLIDPALVDEVINDTITGNYDYGSNTLTEDFPDGQDIEVFKMSALKYAWENASKSSDREHVTPYIRENCDLKGGKLFKGYDYKSPQNYNDIRMTVDVPEDLEVIKWLISEIGSIASWQQYVKIMKEHPEKLINSNIIRNEGYNISKLKD